MNELLSHIEKTLAITDFDAALAGYAELYAQSPQFFLQRPYKNKNHLTHVQNAANLARLTLYHKIQPFGEVSARVKAAIEHFVGKTPLQLSPLQRPSYFYVPGLRDNAFYDESEFKDFAMIREQAAPLLKAYAASMEELGSQNYLDDFGNLPDTPHWRALNQNKWMSTTLIKGGEPLALDDESLIQIRDVVAKNDLADCPPHAPEMFLSVLKPDAYIPPHFGLSNVKVTAHLPLKVNKHAWLEVKGEKRNWADRDYLIFDDSLQHSAGNPHHEERAVLIFDLWHPDLNEDERSAISSLIHTQQQWHKSYGMLASVDRGTY
ncbi:MULTISPECIES: aspartyl/asparaginyl beta-hydroxylase domain-containing protein [Marisediminitalea]|jgi:hypothetical protein|uniref:aspartyl/asparaginyl beta-hydroxylase domain-containing protein n=1 Tax=Marisediminitalea TaxID=2662254 RepID=UPI000C405D04|nr:aspartyl/asparaginyl beta-hydroxylase domain-containing protein [Marisediminitalea aggregata]MBL52610.1 hypothetical protein [Alteromonadaceae bacterium]MCP9478007.1 aspartyl/asparaginyl beta-hydroxylase domain-containing protein [Marisediminitalea aggregata]|tara:strand:+ start:10141 stop:11100 length:960 start_codon:yes stop_codon:yes gene_type:complete